MDNEHDLTPDAQQQLCTEDFLSISHPEISKRVNEIHTCAYATKEHIKDFSSLILKSGIEPEDPIFQAAIALGRTSLGIQTGTDRTMRFALSSRALESAGSQLSGDMGSLFQRIQHGISSKAVIRKSYLVRERVLQLSKLISELLTKSPGLRESTGDASGPYDSIDFEPSRANGSIALALTVSKVDTAVDSLAAAVTARPSLCTTRNMTLLTSLKRLSSFVPRLGDGEEISDNKISGLLSLCRGIRSELNGLETHSGVEPEANVVQLRLGELTAEMEDLQRW